MPSGIGTSCPRIEELPDPTITAPTDVVIRNSATCVCGSDLWEYRGLNPVPQPTPFGHEYCGVVEAVGTEVTSVEEGDFVIGSFMLSDNTCEICQAGYQSRCVNAGEYTGSQAQYMRVELAD